MDLAQGGLHTTQSILPAQIELRGFKDSENMSTQSWMGRERGVDLEAVGEVMWSK